MDLIREGILEQNYRVKIAFGENCTLFENVKLAILFSLFNKTTSKVRLFCQIL